MTQPKKFGLYNFSDEKSKHYILRVFGLSPYSYYDRGGFGWIRIFFFRVTWKDLTRYELKFSERIGKSKFITLGKWCVTVVINK